MVEDGTINQTTGKRCLAEMLESGKSAAKIVEANGMQQISDSDAVAEMVRNVLESHPEEVRAYHSGKENIAHWLFGQVMKEADGKANPQVVRKILQEKLNQKK